MSTTVNSGASIIKDPNAIRVYTFDWDAEHLATSVEISTSSWVISGPDGALTSDNEAIVTGNRKTRLRLTGGTVGVRYTVTNRIVTNESPAQTMDASVYVRIEHE